MKKRRMTKAEINRASKILVQAPVNLWHIKH